MKTKHTATAPDGTVVTRTSATRTYTHVIVCTRPGESFGAWSWAGSLALANKAADQARRCYSTVVILPATIN